MSEHKNVVLGRAQECPKCGLHNPSGKKLPEECVWCNQKAYAFPSYQFNNTDTERETGMGTYPCNTLRQGRIAKIQKAIHDNAVAHGWWETERPVPEVLCLIHSEVSEALEAYRKGDKDNFAEELADIAIRLLDAAEGYGIDLETEILKKHEYNKTREYKHGGKAC